MSNRTFTVRQIYDILTILIYINLFLTITYTVIVGANVRRTPHINALYTDGNWFVTKALTLLQRNICK